VLQGALATRSALLNELQRGPEVVHIASHVVQGKKSADEAYLALGLDEAGRPDFLTPAELSSRQFPIGVVTLSACSSGAGKTYPGGGLFGLTRAWLLAGAQAVVATHWPIADDSGEMFRPFYASLHATGHATSAGAASALREAQIEMLHSNSWRSQPRYWASYFVIGKD
jgi:CHAT domain-containing protein